MSSFPKLTIGLWVVDLGMIAINTDLWLVDLGKTPKYWPVIVGLIAYIQTGLWLVDLGVIPFDLGMIPKPAFMFTPAYHTREDDSLLHSHKYEDLISCRDRTWKMKSPK
jgi:hypothetical protein